MSVLSNILTPTSIALRPVSIGRHPCWAVPHSLALASARPQANHVAGSDAIHKDELPFPTCASNVRPTSPSPGLPPKSKRSSPQGTFAGLLPLLRRLTCETDKCGKTVNIGATADTDIGWLPASHVPTGP